VKNSNDPIKIAIIDSGFNKLNTFKIDVPLCDQGHYDFRLDMAGIGYDFIGHGTAMTATIVKAAGISKGYCLIIYNIDMITGFGGPKTVELAVKKAIKARVKAINMSFGGKALNLEEHKILRIASKLRIKLFAAAGNESHDLSSVCNYFPACYAQVRSLNPIGALDQFGGRASYSNYGRQVQWYPAGMLGVHGTSSATAYATGLYVKYLLKNVK